MLEVEENAFCGPQSAILSKDGQRLCVSFTQEITKQPS